MAKNLHMYSQQNVRIITPCKMLEKAQVENTLPPRCTTWKMMEWKMHTMKNNRKCTDWNMTENTQPEYDRMKNAQPRNDRKGTPLKMI